MVTQVEVDYSRLAGMVCLRLNQHVDGILITGAIEAALPCCHGTGHLLWELWEVEEKYGFYGASSYPVRCHVALEMGLLRLGYKVSHLMFTEPPYHGPFVSKIDKFEHVEYTNYGWGEGPTHQVALLAAAEQALEAVNGNADRSD